MSLCDHHHGFFRMTNLARVSHSVHRTGPGPRMGITSYRQMSSWETNSARMARHCVSLSSLKRRSASLCLDIQWSFWRAMVSGNVCISESVATDNLDKCSVNAGQQVTFGTLRNYLSMFQNYFIPRLTIIRYYDHYHMLARLGTAPCD